MLLAGTVWERATTSGYNVVGFVAQKFCWHQLQLVFK